MEISRGRGERDLAIDPATMGKDKLDSLRRLQAGDGTKAPVSYIQYIILHLDKLERALGRRMHAE